jgi:hypothetical protein
MSKFWEIRFLWQDDVLSVYCRFDIKRYNEISAMIATRIKALMSMFKKTVPERDGIGLRKIPYQ